MRLTQRSILFTILATGSFGATLIAIYYVIVVRDMRIAAIIFANATTGWALTYSYGSSGLAVGGIRGLLHQDSTNEFS